jgi:hypothetical protein
VTTAPDLPKLERDARLAADAVTAAKAEQAAAAKAATAERQARSIEWAFDTIARYPQRQAEASAEVPPALAAFTAAALEDLPAAPAAYLAIAARMGAANALAQDLATARNTLRAAGILPPMLPGRPDPTGAGAPFPTFGGPPALPPFLDMLASTIDTARAAALRVRPGAEDPGAFTGKASDAMRRDVLRAEYHADEELAVLAAWKLRAPDRWAHVPADQQAAVNAWLACREAAGRGDDPLPKIGGKLREVEPPAFGPGDVVRVRLYDDNHAPRVR